MGWLGLIGTVLGFAIKLLDYLAKKQPSLRAQVLEKRDRIQEQKAEFQKNIKEKNYDKASRQLRDSLDNINALRQLHKNKTTGESGSGDK